MAESDENSEENFDQVVHAYYQSVEAGQHVDPRLFIRQHPGYENELRSFFADLNALGDLPGLGGMEGTIGQTEGTRSRPLFPSVKSGDQVTYIGQYRLIEEIARGGMGVVFKARQEKLGRIVALKMILSGPLASGTEVDRFRREARSAARLQHPNIVAVHEIGQHEGHHFFAMDYVESDSLADRLREGSLSSKESARLIEIIARAMHYAHCEGVLHRDLKPANILVDKFGQPHVTDFGLAKALTDVDQETLQEMTRTGQILGTPSYMSPEQAASKSDLVDVRSDVYSLGAILYACLGGRAPFVGDSSIETLQRVLHEVAPRVRLLNSRVPKDLETICHKAISKEPQHRYSTAEGLAEDLNRFLEGRTVLARPVPMNTRLYRWSRRHPAAALLTALIAIITFIIPTSAVFYAQYESERAEYEKILREKADRESQNAQAATERLAISLENEQKALAAANQALDAARRNAYRSSLFPMVKAYEDGEYGLLRSLLQESEHEQENDLFGWEWHFLERSVRRQATSYQFPHKYVFACYCNDGSLAAFRRENGPIDIRQSSTLALVRTLPGTRQTYFAWHPSRNWLAAAAGDNELCVWDAESGEQITIFRTNNDTPIMRDRGVTWNPAGDQIALGGHRRVDIFEIYGSEDSGRKMECLYYGRFLDWHPTENLLAVGGTNCVEVIDCTEASRVWHRYGNRIPVGGMAWNANGSKLAAAWSYPWFCIEIYDPKGTIINSLQLDRDEISALRWTPDRDELILAGARQKTYWWRTSEKQARRTMKIHEGKPLSIHFGSVTQQMTSFDDRGNFLRFPNKAVQRFDLELEVPTGSSRIYRCLWHPTRPDLIALHSEHLVQVVDVAKAAIIQTLGTMNKFIRLDWHPSEPILASLELDGAVRFRHVLYDTELSKLQASATRYFDSLDFSHDGKQLLVGSGQDFPTKREYSAELITLATDERKFFGAADQRTLARLTPDGKRIVMHSKLNDEMRVRVWDIASNKVIQESPIQSSYLNQMDVHPSGNMAALSGTGGLILLMDLNTGEFIREFTAHTSVIRTLYWSPDGKRLLSGDDDNVVKLWAGDTIELLATFRDGMGAASSWSPDGNHIATCTMDGILRIYGSKPLTSAD